MDSQLCSYTSKSEFIWVRLPQLPTEFYDGIILIKIENAIGNLLKFDACTSSTIRGRYERLCVQLPLEQKVQSYILIRSHNQIILYERDNITCISYGCLGHSPVKCPLKTTQNTQVANEEEKNPAHTEDINGEWRAVSFPKKNKTTIKSSV